MLRLCVYLGLTLFGLAATFVAPVAGAIACFEAYLLNPVVLIGEEAGIRFQLWSTAAFVMSMLLYRPRGVAPVRRELAPVICLWLFVAIGAASAAWAEISSEIALATIYEVFKTVLVVSLVIRAIQNERHMSWVITACILGVWHAAVAHTFGVRFGYVPNRFGREYGVLPDVQTPVMVLFTPLLIVVAMLGSKWQRVLAALAIPFVLNSIVVSYMRTGFVSLLAEIVLLLLFLPRRITLRLIPAVAAAAGLFIFRLTPEDYWERIDTIRAPREEASANSRFVIAEASLRMLQDHPFGVGYRNYPDVSPRYLAPEYLTEGRRSAHNSFFSIACETGVPGFLLWMGAFGGAIWLLRRIRKTADSRNPSRIATYAMGLEIGLYGWLAGGLFQSDHEVDPAYWFVAFAVILTRLHALGRKPAAASETASGEALAVEGAATAS